MANVVSMFFHNRRFALLVVAIVSMIATPADPLSMLIAATVLYAIYELARPLFFRTRET